MKEAVTTLHLHRKMEEASYSSWRLGKRPWGVEVQTLEKGTQLGWGWCLALQKYPGDSDPDL